ncbi:hypothetical protein HZS_718 [Henneguya salminicola]|nr:hypothetical protein HZS_718 [Henneguya salminicola]
MFSLFLTIFLLYCLGITSIPRIIGGAPWNTTSALKYDNIIEIFEKEAIILYGEEFSDNISVVLSIKKNNYSESCEDDRLPKKFILTNISSEHSTAFIELYKENIFPLGTPFYICLGYNENDTITWRHQGDSFVVIFSNPATKLDLWVSTLLLVFLIVLSGLYSGLNLGLMALTPRELDLIKASGTSKEKKYATQIYPIRKKGNILLCSILFGITIFNASATVIIDSLTTGAVAIVISTISIVLLCELLPQSICSKYGLTISAHTTFITKILMIVTWPVSFPLGKFLDYLLGDETPTSYNRQQLLEVFRLNKEGNLAKDEFDIIFGGLKLRSKTVAEIMTPLSQCYMINENSVLDFQTVSDIFKSGFSRIPLYRENTQNVVGLLYLKDITFVDTEEMVPLVNILKFFDHPLIKVVHDITLDRILKEFKKGSSHLAIVITETKLENGSYRHDAIGLVTLEDIIEEIIQSEIFDEKDREKHSKAKRKMKQTTSFRYFTQKNSVLSIDSPSILTDNMVSAICKFMSTCTLKLSLF